MTKLSEISRGVKDPVATAEFYSWLFDMTPEQVATGFRFNCAQGALVIHGDSSTPVAITLSAADAPFKGFDPDGVPVTADTVAAPSGSGHSAGLDHVRLNCSELGAAAKFYRGLGFSFTWSGREDTEINGPHESAVDGATWMHLSCDDGYLSLSQADWQDYGRHSEASGPPRFMHIGLAVENLAQIRDRLERADIAYLPGTPAVGQNLYVNDPDGDPAVGTNVEIIEYLPAVPRSGRRLPSLATGS